MLSLLLLLLLRANIQHDAIPTKGLFALLALSGLLSCAAAQQARVVLDQGALVGLKVFPDSARSAVYTFLGIPYAQPPVGDLRFTPPQHHPGWDGTLQATSLRPICPQLSNTVYDETADGTLARPMAMDEDCLFLNIWAPEAALRYGNLPVLVILTGEEMSYDWPRNRANGLDMAAEGVVVVSVQYRQNIYGWISLGSSELSGNYGLLDQQMALEWLQRNAMKFGGNPDQVTLLGHGTSGAPCAVAHAIAPALHGNRSASSQPPPPPPPPPLFSQLIVMSGGDVENALTSRDLVLATSKVLIQKLGCHFEQRTREMVDCLRAKSLSDLQKAFESVYEHGNGTLRLGPCLPVALARRALRSRPAGGMLPTLMGITSNEGAFLQDFWLELARAGYATTRAYLNHTILPRILRQMGVDPSGPTPGEMTSHIEDALNWLYFSGEAAASVPHLLNAMQRLLSESFYETPFYRLLEAWSGHGSATLHPSAPAPARGLPSTVGGVGGGVTSSTPVETPLYAYIYDAGSAAAPALDMRGRLNLFGGVGHSADLPLLLGPSLFQQIARRRFTPAEEKLCRKVRNSLVNFLKGGNPTPGRIFDGWQPYTRQRKFVYALGEQPPREGGGGGATAAAADFERNLPQIELELAGRAAAGEGPSLSRTNRHQFGQNNNNNEGGGNSLEGRRTPSGAGGGAAEAGGGAAASATNYLATNQADSGYALHLKRVYGFWRVLLPSMAAADGGGGGVDGGGPWNALSGRVRLLEATADAARYRQGFYAMLGLVAVLLAILGLCVYLLRTSANSGTHALRGSNAGRWRL